jgi:hypothetical protein
MSPMEDAVGGAADSPWLFLCVSSRLCVGVRVNFAASRVRPGIDHSPIATGIVPARSFRAHASFNTSSKDGSLWSVSTAASARIDLSLYGSGGISTQSILRFWPADCADEGKSSISSMRGKG